MPTVTALSATRRGGIALHVDGDFVCPVSEVIVARWHLYAGRELADDDLAELLEQASAERIMGDAYRLLGHRVRSRAELRRRLLEKGHSESSTESALQRLELAGHVDDEAFAKAFITDKRDLAGWGRTRIARELRTLGVADSVIEAGLGETDDQGETARALAMLSRKGKARAPLEASKRRAYQMLLRRGYPSSIAYAAIRIWAAQSEPDGHLGHIDATSE